MWMQLRTEVLFSRYTHTPTIKQKITTLRGKPLALSTPRWNKQIDHINKVWEHPALLCHALPPALWRKQFHDTWWTIIRACSCQPHTPCCLGCASFYVVHQSSPWASVTYTMHRNNLAKNEDTSPVLVSQISSEEGEPLTNSLRQGASNLSDLE